MPRLVSLKYLENVEFIMFGSDQQQVDGSGQVEKVEQIAEFKERTNTLLNQIPGQSVPAIRIMG